MHRLTTTFVLGYHGCDASVAKRLVSGERFKPSNNDYDWLGEGIYFWESNLRRGLDFAKEVRKRLGRKAIRVPAVVGAVIDLRLCLDLSTAAGVAEVKGAHKSFESAMTAAGHAMPENRGGRDLLLRNLDRAVLEHLHAVRKSQSLPDIDTVRAFYFEGEPIYPTAGFLEKTHVQICVRNSDCIHGIFQVPLSDLT